jgi:hypothetical protein
MMMMVNTGIWHQQCKVHLLQSNNLLRDHDSYYYIAKKHIRNPASNPDAVDSDGLLADIETTLLTAELST